MKTSQFNIEFELLYTAVIILEVVTTAMASSASGVVCALTENTTVTTDFKSYQ